MNARVTAVSAVLAALVSVSACGTGDSFKEGYEAGRNAGTPAQNNAPAAQPNTASAPVTSVAMPKLVGKNGAIAQDELKTLGFTKIELAADAKSGRQAVFNPANWTVTKVEPGPGTQVKTNQTVVLTMTK